MTLNALFKLDNKTRVDRLVYLDAVDLAERFLPTRVAPPGDDSLFSSADFRSLWTYQAASARFDALRKPDPAVCLGVTFDASGALAGSTTPGLSLLAGAAGSVNSPVDWANIDAPRLGIFALFTDKARQPWYWYLSPAEQEAFDAAWPPIVAWHEATIRKFAYNNPVRPFILPGAPHYVFIDNETQVVREIRKFLGIPPGGN